MSTQSPAHPRDPAFARFASFGGFESVEAQSAKTERGGPVPKTLRLRLWIPACAGMSGGWGS